MRGQSQASAKGGGGTRRSGWRDSLQVGCVWMAMESLQGRVYELAAGLGVCRWRAHGWRQDSLDYAFLWGRRLLTQPVTNCTCAGERVVAEAPAGKRGHTHTHTHAHSPLQTTHTHIHTHTRARTSHGMQRHASTSQIQPIDTLTHVDSVTH